MYPTTLGFALAVTGDHVSVSKCELWDQNEYLTDVDVVGGQAMMDSSRVIRSSFSATIVSEDLVPEDEQSPLYPTGAEFRPYRGIVVNDQPEWVPLGVFGYEDISVTEDSSGLVMQVSGNDRASKYSRSVNVEPISLLKSTNHVEAIEILLGEAGCTEFIDYTQGDTEGIVPSLLYQPGTDLWAASVSIAQAQGKQLYVNRLGVAVLDWVPNPATDAPDVVHDMNSPGSPVTQIERVLSTSNTYNGVVASGEGTDLVRPLSATVWDGDPNSPFYYLGTYGRKPFFYTSPMLLDLGQCVKAAEAKLQLLAGGMEMVTWSEWPNPATDVLDLVHLSREKARLDDTFIIETVSIPLEPTGAMSCTGRNRAMTITEDTA